MKLYDSTGKEQEMYGEELRSALMSGQFKYSADANKKQWSVRDENGDIWDFPNTDEAVKAARASGGKLWMPEDEIRANTTALGTFAKEAASSATLGITDFLRDPETAKIEREEHPIAAGAGQVAGFMVPGIGVAKGVAAGAKAIKAAKVAEVLSKPILGAATIGAAEGVGTGAAQLTKEAISPLDDVNMTHTTWTLGAGLVGGALVGGALGSLTGKSGVLNPDKLRSDVLAPTMSARAAAAKIAETSGEDVNDVLARVATNLNRKDLLRSSPEKTIQAINKHVDDLYGKYDVAINSAKEKVTKIKTNISAIISEDDLPSSKWVDMKSKLIEKAEILEKNGAITKTQLGSIKGEIDDLTSKIDSISKNITDPKKDNSKFIEAFQDLVSLNRGLGDRIGDAAFKQVNGKPVSKFYKNDIYEALKKLRNDMAEGKINTELNGQLNQANKFFQDAIDAKKIARGAIRPDQKGILEQLGLGGLPGVGLGFGAYFNPAIAIPLYLGKLAYAQPGVKLTVANALESSIADSIKSGINNISKVGITFAGGKIGSRIDERQFKEHVEVVHDALTNGPTPEFQQYVSRLDTLKPGMAEKLSGQFMQTASFLQSKMPQIKVVGGLKPREIMPTKTQMDTYSRYLTAATMPQTIIQNLNEGRKLSPEEKEVLDVLFPDLKKLITETVEDQVTSNQIVNRAAYQSVTSQGVDTWSDPAWAGYLQQTFQKDKQQQQEQTQGRVKSKASERTKVKSGLSQ
jgi:hypothetical protein